MRRVKELCSGARISSVAALVSRECAIQSEDKADTTAVNKLKAHCIHKEPCRYSCSFESRAQQKYSRTTIQTMTTRPKEK